MEINDSALIMIYKGELSEDYQILEQFKIVIITEIIDLKAAETLDEYCRSKNIGFIYVAQFGLASFMFTDFGNDFKVENFNGKECEKYFIKSISNSCPGIVEIEPIKIMKNGKKCKKFIKLGTGDFISFKNITGMTELNDTPPRPIRVLSKTKIAIEDTTKFRDFTGAGMIEEVKVAYPLSFSPLSEAKDFIYNEEDIEDDLNDELNLEEENGDENNYNCSWDKMLNNYYNKNDITNHNNISNGKVHLAVLSLHEFMSIHQYLPRYDQQKEIEECINISTKILNKAKNEKKKWANNIENIESIDKIFLEKIFKFSRFYFTPMTCFFGGVVSQEILKYVGLYKPSNQWTYFNFLEMIKEENLHVGLKNKFIDDDYKRNIESYTLFSQEKVNEIKNCNILIIGFNDIGYEILKIFIMLGLLTDNKNNENNIIILDNNKNKGYAKHKLNELKYNDKNDEINIIYDTINDNNSNISEKNWWKKSNIIIDTLSFHFNDKEKHYIIKKCKEDNKILFEINANKTKGSYELILPNQFLKYKKTKNKNNNFSYNEDIITPGGPEPDNDHNKKNNDNDSDNDNLNIINVIKDKNNKYKSIYTFQESFEWSKNFFVTTFKTNIKHINELINKSDSEKELNSYLNDLIEKEKDKEKMLKLIINFKKLVSLKIGLTFESLVYHSIDMFQELFEFCVDELLREYPSDLIEHNTRKKFWSGKRLIPKKIKFDLNNEEHYQFIYYLTLFLGRILKLEGIDEKMKMLKDIASKFKLKVHDITLYKKANDKDFFEIEKNTLIKFFEIMKTNKDIFLDIDMDYLNNDNNNIDDKDEYLNYFGKINKQLKFLLLASNIKLSNYGLDKKNIIPELASVLGIDNVLPTVGSSISGLVVLQLFNMVNDSDFCEYIKLVKEGKIINENNDNDNLNSINIINDNDNNNTNDLSFYKNASFNWANNICLLYDMLIVKK